MTIAFALCTLIQSPNGGMVSDRETRGNRIRTAGIWELFEIPFERSRSNSAPKKAWSLSLGFSLVRAQSSFSLRSPMWSSLTDSAVSFFPSSDPFPLPVLCSQVPAAPPSNQRGCPLEALHALCRRFLGRQPSDLALLLNTLSQLFLPFAFCAAVSSCISELRNKFANVVRLKLPLCSTFQMKFLASDKSTKSCFWPFSRTIHKQLFPLSFLYWLLPTYCFSADSSASSLY